MSKNNGTECSWFSNYQSNSITPISWPLAFLMWTEWVCCDLAAGELQGLVSSTKYKLLESNIYILALRWHQQ